MVNVWFLAPPTICKYQSEKRPGERRRKRRKRRSRRRGRQLHTQIQTHTQKRISGEKT